MLIELLIRMPVVLLALTVHEFCHAWIAYRMGDPTAYMQGRCTLNPLKHLDPLGTLCLLFAPIGWARPVPVNPLNFRNLRRGELLTTAAGPASNLVQAVFFALLLRGAFFAVDHFENEISRPMAYFLLAMIAMFALAVQINVALAIFNCLPLFPLDGFHITANLISPRYREWFEQNRIYGPYLILGIIVVERASKIPILSRLIDPPANLLFHYVAGGNPFMWLRGLPT